MWTNVFVQFASDGDDGFPYSWEPRKWVACLTEYQITPDGWSKTGLDRRVAACGLSEIPNSLNLELWNGMWFKQDLEQIRRTLPGVIHVGEFERKPQTPRLTPILKPQLPQRTVLALRVLQAA